MTESLDLFKSIEIDSHAAVYTQIANTVLFAVASGRLGDGDQLPPAKKLAERLGVNFNTVMKSYRDLEVLGLTFTRRGMGVFIRENARKECQKRIRSEILGRLYQAVSEAKAAGMSGAEINAAVKTCQANDAKIYGPTPKEVLALAKEK